MRGQQVTASDTSGAGGDYTSTTMSLAEGQTAKAEEEGK